MAEPRMAAAHPDAPEPSVPDEAALDFPEKEREEDPLWFEQKPSRDFDFDD